MTDVVETGFTFSVSTGNITRIEFERHSADYPHVWRYVDGEESWLNGSYTIGRDLFMTEAEARQAGEAARLKKIQSLRKQLLKLERMSFATKNGMTLGTATQGGE